VTNANERRCRAQNKRGERCAAHVINAAGYCVAHDPERPADMRALGRKSAAARRKPHPERVNESLRTYLKREVAPSEVWAALKLAMEGQNESARVAASRVLMDALAEPERDKDARATVDRQYAISNAKARLSALLEAGLSPEEAAEKLDDESVDDHPYLIRNDTTPEQAKQIIDGLVEMGVLDWRIEELAQKRAEEMTRIFRQEHGLPALPVSS
jgi:hypothetical protein